MAKPSTAFTKAVAELAAQCGNRQWSNDVTVDDAREYVDAKVIADWLVDEAAGRDLEIILADTIAQRMNSVQARGVLCSLAVGNALSAFDGMRTALVEQVARDLSYAAQKLVDEFDPTDAEMSRSFAVEVDDPLIADQRYLARSYR